jgi:hypothetical protein
LNDFISLFHSKKARNVTSNFLSPLWCNGCHCWSVFIRFTLRISVEREGLQTEAFLISCFSEGSADIDYEGRLESSWTHLINPSRNFVEVRWRSLFRSTSLGKRCTFYNAPPISRKRAADRWSLRNFLPRSSLFMVGRAQKSHGARSWLYGGCFNGDPPIHFFQIEHRIQFRSRPMWFLCFSNLEIGALRQISKWSTVCSTFSRSGWSVVRSLLVATRSTSKRDRHRTSTKFRLGVIRWVYELCKRPS